MRFFSPAVNLAAAAEQESTVDYRSDFGLVATAGPSERIVGHGMYARTGDERAEVAFTIDEAFRGRGLGTILLGELAEVAAVNGIQVFEAEVLPENRSMLGVFRESGLPIEVRPSYSTVKVTLGTSLTEQAIQRFERREQVAAANALQRF